ncbi:MAG: ACP S-malonyltransferase [Blastocatellia bacterium]
MILVLLDNDLRGRLELLDGSLKQSRWSDLDLFGFITFDEVGLERDAKDREVWHRTQELGLILLTGNRNQDDDTSLEQTLRDENTPLSLPVVTVGAPQRLPNPAYREQCIDRLVEIVFDLENYLGCGRQYIP